MLGNHHDIDQTFLVSFLFACNTFLSILETAKSAYKQEFGAPVAVPFN